MARHWGDEPVTYRAHNFKGQGATWHNSGCNLESTKCCFLGKFEFFHDSPQKWSPKECLFLRDATSHHLGSATHLWHVIGVMSLSRIARITSKAKAQHGATRGATWRAQNAVFLGNLSFFTTLHKNGPRKNALFSVTLQATILRVPLTCGTSLGRRVCYVLRA